MPELPEVETVARGVARHINGLTIASIHLARTDIVHGINTPMSTLLPQRSIETVAREGKRIRFRLSGNVSMVIHLGMTGRLTVNDRHASVEPHTHLRVTFNQGNKELRFTDPRRFGGVWLLNGATVKNGDWIGRRLPPTGADPLDIAFADFRTLLHRRRQIKALLLDQQPISGIGNIYCDEALHRAGVHPLARANELNDTVLRRLWRSLRRVLDEAIQAGGSSISDYRNADNVAGWFHVKHRVYNRTGKPCRRCRTPIERLVVAGRGTHICPRCQTLKKT